MSDLEKQGLLPSYRESELSAIHTANNNDFCDIENGASADTTQRRVRRRRIALLPLLSFVLTIFFLFSIYTSTPVAEPGASLSVDDTATFSLSSSSIPFGSNLRGFSAAAGLGRPCPHKFKALTKDICPLITPIAASDDNYAYFRTPEFTNFSVAALIGAVNIPTESFDNLGPVGEDARWDVFFKLEEYLKSTFPKVHEQLDFVNVNTHGLVYTWHGTDSSLKPSLLAAHQDVVPVLPSTRGQWDHDPYDAYFDGTTIWGRGVSDDKNSLVGILEAIEIILTREPEYTPRRTLVVAFGFDEEVSGYRGAGEITKHLQSVWGPESFEVLVDEGGQGIFEFHGVQLAVPGIGEKGYFDAKVTLNTPGGHSSIPPDHTSIGIIGDLSTLIENDPFEPVLSVHNPYYQFLQCLAVHSDEINPAFRAAILKAGHNSVANRAVQRVISADRLTRYNIQTSQALDLVSGGLKINALPEEVVLAVNFRVSVDSSVTETREKLVGNVKTIAEKYGLGLKVNATSKQSDATSGDPNVVQILPATERGEFIIENYASFIEPAPISPVTGATWETLAGTIREVFENFAGPIIDPLNPPADKSQQQQGQGDSMDAKKKKKPIIIAPSLMTANTDTKHYWPLTKNIYRFSPTRVTDIRMGNIHTVNENLPFEVHRESVVFYYSFIKNFSK
jgi:Gly-Xaa carboxypeptidase